MSKRGRFAERPASQQRGWVFMAALGSLGVLVALGLLFIGFNAPNNIPGRGYYNVNAQFAKADNITPHSQVRLNGKLVGQVLDPHVNHGLAQVKLQLEPSVKPLKSDTRIEVRPRSPVGVRYLDITAGTKGTDLPDNATIPAKNTRVTRQLDEALSTFDPDTRQKTQMFLKELGTGFAGRGQDLNETMGAAPKFLDNTDAVLGTVVRRTGAVAGFINGTKSAAVAADPVRQTIATGFKPGANALRPFSQEGDAVHRILDTAPAAFGSLSGSLPRVDPLLNQLNGFAAAINPGLRDAPAAFSQASALLSESRVGLRNAKTTLNEAGKAVSPTLGLLKTVDPILPQLTTTLKNTAPVLNTLGVYGCDIKMFGNNWTSMENYGNAAGGVLRFNVTTPGAESLAGSTTQPGGAFRIPRDPSPNPCTSNTQGKKGN